MPVVLPKRPQSLLARTPVASAVLLALASPSAAGAGHHGPRRSDRHRAEARREPARRADQYRDAGTKSWTNCKSRASRTTCCCCRASPRLGRQHRLGLRLQRRSTCAASRPAATARRRPRSRASACTSTSSPSRRCRATSTFTCTTSRASRRSRDRRARCMARARRRARSASSRTSRTLPASPPATRWKATIVDDGRYRLRRRGIRQHPARRKRGRSPRRLVDARRGLDRQRRRVPASMPGDRSTTADDITANNADSSRTTTTRSTRSARARRCASTSARTGRVTPRLMCQKTDSEGSWGDDLSDVLLAGQRRVAHFRDECSNDEWYQAGLTIEGRSAISTSSIRATTSSATSTARSTTRTTPTGTTRRHDRLLRAPVRRQRRQPLDRRHIPSSTTTTTPRRATRCASARRRRSASAACSGSSTRSSSTISTSLSAGSRDSRTTCR